MKDKTKKRLIIAGLAAVCVLAVFGISRVLYKEPVQTLPEEGKPAEEVELVVDTDETMQVPEETESTEEKTDLVIEVETDNTVESGTQEIQPDPVKTEDEKPKEPPALAEDADVTNPNIEPAYEEPTQNGEAAEKAENNTPASDNGAPSHGDTKDGMIYIDGFGWVPNEGGGGSGTEADDMYENGNKVGIMD